jgi:WD40 repeat protein
VWRLDGRAPTVLRDRADYRLQAASLSPDGRIVATANFVLAPPRLWDAATGRLLHDLGPANATDDIQFSPDGRTVATCDQNGRAQLWSTSGRLLRTVAASGPSSEGGGRYVWKVRFSPDGTRLLTADGDGTARVFSVASGRQVSLLAGQSRDVHAIAWSPNGRLVLTGSDDHTARLWTVAAHSYTRFDLPAAVEDVEFSRDGSRIVIGAADGTVRVYDTATGSQLYGLDGHTSAIGSASFSPDGRQLLTVAGDGTARLWDVAPVRPRQAPVIHVAEFESQLGQDRARPPAPLDRRLALQQLDRLRVYDPRTRRTTARLPRLRKGDYEGAVFDRAGRVMLVLRSGGRGYLPVQLRRADGGRLLRTLAGPGSQASIGAMTPDGSLVAAADQQGRVGVWDAASGRRLTTFRGHATGLRPTAGQSVAGLAFSDDGRLILSADTLGRDFVWDPHTGRLLNRIRGPAIPPRYLPEIGGTFSPDDRLVAAVWPWDAAVHLYAVGVRGEQAELRAPIVGVFDAAFNQDGSLLATVGQGVAIWDVRQRQLLTTIPLGQDDFRYRVQFTADGTAVATNAASASVSEVIPSEVYPCVVCGSADRLLALARPRVTRRLKAAERAAYLPG